MIFSYKKIGGIKHPLFYNVVILISSGVVTASSVAVATASVRSFFSGACYVYCDNLLVVFSTVQFVNSFLSSCIVRHFYECESSGSSAFSVSNYSC